MKLTQQWLGHSNSGTTLEIYTHVGKEQEQETGQALQQAILAPRLEVPSN